MHTWLNIEEESKKNNFSLKFILFPSIGPDRPLATIYNIASRGFMVHAAERAFNLGGWPRKS